MELAVVLARSRPYLDSSRSSSVTPRKRTSEESLIREGGDVGLLVGEDGLGGLELWLVGLVDELIAVWDGKPARGYGGTADVVAYAERTGVPVRVLWPEGASR